MSHWVDGILFTKGAWAPAVILLWALLSLAGWSSYQPAQSPKVRWIGALIRSLGLGIMCFCLLDPIRTTTVPKSQANTIAVLLDNSRSMRALYQRPGSADRDLSPTGVEKEQEDLLESFSKVIADDAHWLEELGTQYRIRKYLFADQLNSVDDFKGWNGSQYSSNIQGAIATLKSRYVSEPPAAIVLITDGRSTNRIGFQEAAKEIANAKTPVFPVLIPPQGDQRRDLWIQDVSVQTSDFETAPVTISASLGHRGLASERVEVRLEDMNQTVLQTQVIELTSSSKRPVFRFQFRPKENGSQGYMLACRSLREIPGLEMTLDNNRRFVAVDRAMGPYRILYLSGRPNWEFKFLQRALSDDAEVSMSALVRIAKKQPKFSFRGKGSGDTNPLFSGFEDISDEEKEKYNEPVFARLGVAGKEELASGFPKDIQELYAYSMVIIDDLETEFFTVDQLQLLRQFVSQRGGTLLMLGGQESMRGRSFRDSVLGQLLPVYGDPQEPQMDIPNIEQEAPDTIRYQLSREGWLQPYLRLHDNELDERKRLDQMPVFQVWNRTSQIKAGARVLAEGQLPDGQKAPLLVVQKFGKGTTGSLMVGDLWRWAMMNAQESVSPFYQGWRQLIRGLIVDIPRRVQMTGRIDAKQNSRRLIDVQVRDQGFASMDNALVEIEIKPPGGESLKTKGTPSLESAGLYQTSFLMRDSGVYHVTARACEPDGSVIGHSQMAFVYEPEAEELANISIDQESLVSIAESSGGELIPYDSLESIRNKIPIDQLRFTQKRTSPLWHTPWLLGFAIGCLAIEWWWRRRHGLA